MTMDATFRSREGMTATISNHDGSFVLTMRDRRGRIWRRRCHVSRNDAETEMWRASRAWRCA